MKSRTIRILAVFGAGGTVGGCAVVMVVIGIGALFLFWLETPSAPDAQALDAAHEMAQWTAGDLDTLWDQAHGIWKDFDGGETPIETDLKPDLLIDYRVFIARHGLIAMRGGSSFGLTGAHVECVFEGRTAPKNGEPVPLIPDEGVTCSAPGVWGHYVAGSGEWHLEGTAPTKRR